MIRVWILVSVVVFSAVRADIIGDGLGEGETCLIGGLLPPRSCGRGLTCVIKNFGKKFIDIPATGECTAVEDMPNSCSVTLCTKGGADAICNVSGLVATCEAWATRTDLPSVRCPEICTQECLVPRLVASNGEEFCNLCLLQSASCESNFKIFGPVEDANPKCREPISLFDAQECCIEEGIGCIGKGEVCSTAGSLIPPVPCEKGLTCVIRDFGFPAADQPNSGKCRRVVRRVRKCSVRRCSRFGGGYVCEVPVPRRSGIVSTCKAWARRSDGNAGPDCDFVCREFCRTTRKPVASNGQEFCSICKLRQASCESDFMIFGPVSRK